MNAANLKTTDSALDDANDITAKFLGTDNPRHVRVINALLEKPRLREELDRLAGCSNGPELIAELRRRGLDVPCNRTKVLDRDGKITRPGIYSFIHSDRQKIHSWRARLDASHS